MLKARIPLDDVRNIGIIAHIDAGKTTTTERILYYSGLIHRMGSVDEGTTVTDWMEQERERGITIVSAAITTRWRGCQINLIDTPGHIDFTAEVQRALRVLDGCIVMFDAVHGVEPQSETVWHQAEQYSVPRICFINKMDRIGADFKRALAMLCERLGAKALALQLPMGAEAQFQGVIDLLTLKAIRWTDEVGAQREYGPVPFAYQDAARHARNEAIEKIVETDDALLEQYLEGREPDTLALIAALRRATIANQLFPVFCGAARRNKGVQPLLDAVVDFLPSPRDVPAIQGIDPRTGAELTRRASAAEPFCALVFKTVTDPFVGRLLYLRVYSGRLLSGDTVYNAARSERERIGRLVRIYADRREEIAEIGAGDIAAVLGMKHAFTGHTLCDSDYPILLEPITFPEPVVNIAIEPSTAADEDRISYALKCLSEDDPTLGVATDENTGQRLLAGMGELHLEVLVERLKRDYGLRVRTGKPRVSYKETITQPVARAEGCYIRQTGGRGQYGHVLLALAPGEPGSGLVFNNRITGEAIPKVFIPAVEKGVREAAQGGVLAGFTVIDVAVTLYDGSFHAIDSSELAFETAAVMAFQDGMKQGAPVLLEPMFRLEVLVPEECTGVVLGQLTAQRCEIEKTETRPGGIQAIRGTAPLSELFGYATQLRSVTQGRGLFSMEFDHFSQVPAQRMQQLLLS